MNWRAIRTSALLCALFVIVYGTSNWFTSLRHDVPSFFFGWERSIPFVPWLIVPYMSIDLFFIASPFFCRDDLERRVLAKRIAAAILIAGAFFFFLPLQFSFERPVVGGWLGEIFNNFRLLDQPFNQLPSLHITLGIILLDHFARRTRGALRITLFLWFTLIGLSAVLTYQHHVIDVVGGAALAVICVHFFQRDPLRQPSAGNTRVGVLYLIASIIFFAASLIARPWSYVLIWPATSLAIVTAGYFGWGPGIYRKSAGRLPVTTWLIFWPILIGQRISLAYYARQCRPFDRVTDRLFIGRRLSWDEAADAVAAGVTAVVDLTAEFSEVDSLRQLVYLQSPTVDLTAPLPSQLDAIIHWIQTRPASDVVYIHCKIGYSRTAAVAASWLISNGDTNGADDAIAMLRAARPSIIIRPEAEAAIRAFAKKHNASRKMLEPARIT